MPRKTRVPTEELVETIQKYSFEVFDKENKPFGPSHPVWEEISAKLHGQILSKNVYTRVRYNRHHISEMLSHLHTNPGKEFSGSATENLQITASSANDNYNSMEVEDIQDVLEIDLLIAYKQWLKMGVKDVMYGNKKYTILSQGTWAPIIQKAFWSQTKLQCTLAFKRIIVNRSGFNFCIIRGTCLSCKSNLKIILSQEPSLEKDKITFKGTYTGKYNKCKSKQKCKMTDHQKESIIKEQIKEQIPASAIRCRLAKKNIVFGHSKPYSIPTYNTMKVVKSRALQSSREFDVVTSNIFQLKYNQYSNCIHDVGFDPFFVHYWTANEINIYREYTKQANFSSIAIDAIGNLVSEPLVNHKRKILLYKMAISDKLSNIQFSIAHMLSQRHDNNAINFWLTNWLQCTKVECPREVVTNMSLALLSGIVKAFTPYSTVWSYIQCCYNILNSNIQDAKSQLKCFIRCDVIHVVKIIKTWPYLQDKRVEEFIVKVIGQILMSKELNDVKNLLKFIFWLLYSKTVGIQLNGKKTIAEEGRLILRARIATEQFDDKLYRSLLNDRCNPDPLLSSDSNEIPSKYEDPNNIGIYTEQHEHTITECDKSNPFYMMAHKIAEDCLKEIDRQEDGDHENLYYLPHIVPFILHLCSYLPLWSGIMCPKFDCENHPPSNTAIESQFSDLKNQVLKNCTLPMRVDDFLQIHIDSLNESAMLAHSKILQRSYPSEENEEVVEIPINRTLARQQSPPTSSEITSIQIPTNEVQDSLISSYCAGGHEPIGTHNCLPCNQPAHLLPGYSVSIGNVEGYGEKRLYIKSQEKTTHNINQVFEDGLQENCLNTVSKQLKRKKSVYLTTKCKQLHKKLNFQAKAKVIGLLRNASNYDLRTVKIDEHTVVSLINTCTFDSVVQCLAVAYCDSDKYSQFVDNNKTDSKLFELIADLLSHGVTVQSYKKRASILFNLHGNQPMRGSRYGRRYTISAESSAEKLVQKLLEMYPSYRSTIKCNFCNSTDSKNTIVFSVVFDLESKQINCDSIQNLLIQTIQNSEDQKCKQCNDVVQNEIEYGYHVIFSLININVIDRIQKSMVVPDICLTMENIPKNLQIEEQKYYFRGAVSTNAAQQKFRSYESIGHYKAITWRQPIKEWQLYDDSLDTVSKIKKNIPIFAELLIYSQ